MCQGLHRSPWNQSQIVFIFDWLFRGVSSLRHIETNFRPSCKLAEEPLTSPEDAPMVCSALKLVVSIHNKQLPPPNGVRLFARQTFTTPKIRTFTTPKFGHFPPQKKHLPGGQLPPPIFFLLFLTHFSWLFRLTAHGGHQGWEGGGA